MPSLIKQTDEPKRNDCTAFQFADMSGDAGKSLELAHRRVTEIIASAEADAVEIRAAATRKAKALVDQSSDKAVGDRVAAETDNLRAALQKAIGQLNETEQSWRAEAEAFVIELASAIAKRILRRELVSQPDVPLALVREALEMASSAKHVKLFMHPNDLEKLRPQVEQISAEMYRTSPAEIVTDESVGVGGCRVETPQGLIDQSIDVQLRRIGEELHDH